MATYLMLKEKAQAFRADPRVTEALQYSGVLDLATPTIAEGESLDEFRKADDGFDADQAAERDFGFVRLQQLAVEHLLG
jgi:xylose isomerase